MKTTSGHWSQNTAGRRGASERRRKRFHRGTPENGGTLGGVEEAFGTVLLLVVIAATIAALISLRGGALRPRRARRAVRGRQPDAARPAAAPSPPPSATPRSARCSPPATTAARPGPGAASTSRTSCSASRGQRAERRPRPGGRGPPARGGPQRAPRSARASRRWTSRRRSSGSFASWRRLARRATGRMRRMADPKTFELDELVTRPGTYFNPQTDVLVRSSTTAPTSTTRSSTWRRSRAPTGSSSPTTCRSTRPGATSSSSASR